MDHRRSHTYHQDWYLDFESRKEVYAPTLAFMEAANLEGAQVLEVGCASGAFLRYLETSTLHISEAVGVEPDAESLSHARTGSVVCGSALDLPFPDVSFDYVILVSVLHHVVGKTLSECRRNWNRVVLEAERVCRPSGHIIITEGLAVKNRPFQRFVFFVTSALAKCGIGLGQIHLEKGEVLAFLTPRDLSHLDDVVKGSSQVQFTNDLRPGTEFSGIVRKFWQWQTCRVTTIFQRH